LKRSGTGFDLPTKKSQFEEIQQQMAAPDFWDNPEVAQKIATRLSGLKAVIGPIEKCQSSVNDMADLFEMAMEESDTEILGQLAEDLKDVTDQCEKIELQGLLCGDNDMNNCFFSIHAGAGGTESCDWASMLLRMYSRYFERNRYKFKELDITAGEEAGIRSITLEVAGPFAFGKLSCEVGVHRLVRISPFDSQKRRHTSFAAVDCIPDFGEDIEIEIDDDDLRIDFYRASGAGGQHVNKTSSAVRITHQPSGIVVQCQNDRSQHKNKAQAMKMLKAKLYMREEQKRNDKVAKLYGNKGEIAWGSQIRSYVMQPYQMVKDHRTDFQTGNVSAVMDGELDGFIESYLRFRAKSKNNNK
jgi:peptide chain release factor 2